VGRIQKDLRHIANQVYDISEYSLLPNLAFLPVNLTNDIVSLESKRKLLLCLAPILTQAEKQRKIDANLCEDYTKCRSEKSKLTGEYEYYDINTGMMVNVFEYQKR